MVNKMHNALKALLTPLLNIKHRFVDNYHDRRWKEAFQSVLDRASPEHRSMIEHLLVNQRNHIVDHTPGSLSDHLSAFVGAGHSILDIQTLCDVVGVQPCPENNMVYYMASNVPNHPPSITVKSAGISPKTYNLAGIPNGSVVDGLTRMVISDLSAIALRDAHPVSRSSFAFSRELAHHIHLTANLIARQTRRGVGNFIIAAPSVVETLNQSRDVYRSSGPRNDSSALHYDGLLSGGIKVFSSDAMLPDRVLVGYKGKFPIDAGYILVPNIVSTNRAMCTNFAKFVPTGDEIEAHWYYKMLTLVDD